MGVKPRVLVVGDSWGAVGLPALTAAGVEFVFSDLYRNPCDLAVVFTIAPPQGPGPSPTSPVPSPEFCSESASVTGGTEQGSESLEGQTKTRLCGTPGVRFRGCRRLPSHPSRCVKAASCEPVFLAPDSKASTWKGKTKDPNQATRGNEVSGVASKAMSQVS